MPEPLKIRAGTYNMFEGGLNGEGDHKDDTRLNEQISMLSPLRLDLLGLQEATWGEFAEKRIRHVAQILGMSWHTIARSNFYGCDIAVLVKESDSVKVTRRHHLSGPPFTHAHVDVELYVAQWHRRVHFMAGHLSPSSPTMRRAEAELVGVYRGLDLIYVADFNAAALDDNPDTTGIDPLKIARKLDTGPAEELAAAGFCDVASHLGDSTPTVGHGNDKLAYRCDRIYTTLPRESIRGYGVVQEQRPLSDHRPVWAEFVLGG